MVLHFWSQEKLERVRDGFQPKNVVGTGRLRAAAAEAFRGRPPTILNVRRRPQRSND